MKEVRFIELIFSEGAQTYKVHVATAEFDERILAKSAMLVGSEKSTYNEFKSDVRRKEYLAGRTLAKLQVFEHESAVPIRSMEIVTAHWGNPLWKNLELSQYSLSIAHTKNQVATLSTAFNTHPLGLDLEEISSSQAEILRSYFSDLGQSYSEEELHVIWAARESAAKALKTGFTIPDSLFSVEDFTKTPEGYFIQYASLKRLQAYAWKEGDCVLCLTYPVEWKLQSKSIATTFNNN